MHRNRLFLSVALVLLALPSGQLSAMEIPFLHLNFDIGTQVMVIPAADDRSRQMGLVFITEKVKTDYRTGLSIKGMVVNNGVTSYDSITVTFKVESLENDHIVNGKFGVEPSSLAPGSAADFEYHMSMHGKRPRVVRYKITAIPAGNPAITHQ
jgi:hypothetical protein